MFKSFTITLTVLCLSLSFACAKAKSDAKEVEVKCLVPDEKIAEITAKLGLASKEPLIRVVCFFDTGSLTLFQHEPKKLILRSRYEPADADKTETTVKVRGGSVEGEDVKCEFDKVVGKPRTESCSVDSKKQQLGEIKAANLGTDIKKIFSKKQEAVAERAFGKIEWDKIKPYGPVDGVQVWKKIEFQGGPSMTVERWDLPARPGKAARVIFEVSAKVPEADEAKAEKWITDLIGISEGGPGGESESKTKIVLEHFAAADAR
jgi:hypothetical protein